MEYNNCIVTRLKETVNNSSLNYLDYYLIEVSTNYNTTDNICPTYNMSVKYNDDLKKTIKCLDGSLFTPTNTPNSSSLTDHLDFTNQSFHWGMNGLGKILLPKYNIKHLDNLLLNATDGSYSKFVNPQSVKEFLDCTDAITYFSPYNNMVVDCTLDDICHKMIPGNATESVRLNINIPEFYDISGNIESLNNLGKFNTLLLPKSTNLRGSVNNITNVAFNNNVYINFANLPNVTGSIRTFIENNNLQNTLLKINIIGSGITNDYANTSYITIQH